MAKRKITGKKTTRKRNLTSKLEARKETTEYIGIVRNDPYLEPYEDAIRGRHDHALWKIDQLTNHGKQTLSDFANGHEYFGLHRTDRGWVFREWAPHATGICLVGDFSGWKELDAYRCHRIEDTENWELTLPAAALSHGQLYKMHVKWDGGEGERIPAWANRVVQDEQTHIFSAQVWSPKTPYRWRSKPLCPQTKPLLIYECHIGMAQDEEKVGTYSEFRERILPRIVRDGYNAIQIMAVQEHPYYGSFGYHVSSFFAPSSRFGTPEELKRLIDEAHRLGIAVIMDIVHSHAVKNEVEGLANLAGDPNQYFYPGERHEHPAWDSLCFDYGKDNVIRFNGVTSMLYYSHGLGEAFTNYADYFNGHQDDNAICYLTLANRLVHEVNPNALTIAEEVSGMPGLAARFEDGGYGFDYRMAMNIPDYWIKTIKERRDEEWKPSSIFWEVRNRRADEKTISYCESHDQALVGDKTIIFRLVDADMYWHFRIGDENEAVHRGIALHKMIRLVTIGAINGGYLNFMGNEFGHPEWIDFPREGNGWSYKYARRQWNLVDDPTLCYHYLGDFDRRMLEVVKSETDFNDTPVQEIWHNDGDQVLAYERGWLLFVFNFSPSRSYTDYGLLVGEGAWEVVLNTDARKFGGNGLADDTVVHLTNADPLYAKEHKGWLKLYIPARSAVVLRKKKDDHA